MQDSMIFYSSFYRAIKELDLPTQAEVYNAIFSYALEDKYPEELSTMASVVFTLIKPQIDANIQRRENGKKGAKSGKKGGRPKKENTIGDNNKNPIGVIEENPIPLEEETPLGFEVKTPNVNVNVNVNDNVNENVFISLPLNDGKHNVTKAEVEEYKKLYPNVNIEQELRSMYGWLDANPKRRKTKTGIRRFINGWLSREQDKPQTKPAIQKSQYNFEEMQKFLEDN